MYSAMNKTKNSCSQEIYMALGDIINNSTRKYVICEMDVKTKKKTKTGKKRIKERQEEAVRREDINNILTCK